MQWWDEALVIGLGSISYHDSQTCCLVIQDFDQKSLEGSDVTL